ncbi:hypothetical protein SLS53_006907 [Cytospora paraplurivora]|uniref:Uncharacterized protein n=1 Tax=Cytospora paraplurivora TaxID=2898453 RepID=A0AAN9U4T9_9PEZI
MILINLLILLVAAMGAAAAPESFGGPASLEARNEWKFCGNFVTGDREGAKRLANDIENGDFGDKFGIEGTDNTDPHTNSSCLGVGCDVKTYTSVWDNTYDITKDKDDVAYWMNRIIDECCTDISGDGVSGQYFLGDGTNIVLAYNSCKTYSNPSDGGEGHGECKG